MRESRKSQLTSFAILLAIGILSVFLLVAMNFLAWPVGQEVGKIATVNPIPEKVPDGVFMVTVFSSSIHREQLLLQDSMNRASAILVTQPFRGFASRHFAGTGSMPFVTNRTIDSGQVQENVAPNTYSVKMLDWRLNNFSTAVTVFSNEITSLTVTLNATSLHGPGISRAGSLILPDSLSAGSRCTCIWTAVHPLAAQNPQTYLDTQIPPETPISSISDPRADYFSDRRFRAEPEISRNGCN